MADGENNDPKLIEKVKNTSGLDQEVIKILDNNGWNLNDGSLYADVWQLGGKSQENMEMKEYQGKLPQLYEISKLLGQDKLVQQKSNSYLVSSEHYPLNFQHIVVNGTIDPEATIKLIKQGDKSILSQAPGSNVQWDYSKEKVEVPKPDTIQNNAKFQISQPVQKDDKAKSSGVEMKPSATFQPKQLIKVSMTPDLDNKYTDENGKTVFKDPQGIKYLAHYHDGSTQPISEADYYQLHNGFNKADPLTKEKMNQEFFKAQQDQYQKSLS